MTAGFFVVIPARYDSTRLPGKPLADIGGEAMIVRVAQQAAAAGAIDVTVATDDDRVRDVVRQAGFNAELTAASHQSGSDRIFEVVQRRGLGDDDIVLNVQGDEPLLPSALIAQVGQRMQSHSEIAVCTLREPIGDDEEFNDPNCVKVVTDKNDRALLFSRAGIPHPRSGSPMSGTAAPRWRHIGLYGYRVGVLAEFVALSPSTLERQESLEQLRLLENGIDIVVLEACQPAPGGVDTPADLERARRVFERG